MELVPSSSHPFLDMAATVRNPLVLAPILLLLPLKGKPPMGFGIPASMLGLVVSGDLAGQTIYTDRHGRKTFFVQAPPLKPPSPMQLAQRARFRVALENWALASTSDRSGYEAISLAAGLCMTGLNLWIHVSLQGSLQFLATLQRQTGISVGDPPFVPWPGP